MGYSGKQIPSGMVSRGPCVGPPGSIRSLSFRGRDSGDADASLGGLLVVGGRLLGEGLLVVGVGDSLPRPSCFLPFKLARNHTMVQVTLCVFGVVSLFV